MRKLFVILSMLAALLMLSATALAASSLVDDAKLLTNEQRRTVLAELQKQEQAHGVRMAVVTMKSVNGKPGQVANKLLDTVYNDGKNGNMVLLQVTGSSQWYIATDKQLKNVIKGDEAIEHMSKPMVAKFKKGNYSDGYIAYAQKGGELLSYYEKEGKPWTPNAGFNWMTLVSGLAIGAIVAYGYRTSLISSMSNVRAQTAANAYLNQESFTVKSSNDSYLYTNVSVVKKPKANDRGGGVTDHCGDAGHGGGGGRY